MPNGDNLRREAEEAREDARRLRMELTEGLLNDLSAIEATARDDRQHRQIADDLERARNRAVELLDRISHLLARIQERPEPLEIARGAGMGFRLTTLASELQAELEWLKAIIEELEGTIKQPSAAVSQWFANKVAQPVHTALTKIRSVLMPLLKKFLAKLWSVISHLLTPKEWKLKGKVGSTVLGLAQAEIEITFGP